MGQPKGSIPWNKGLTKEDDPRLKHSEETKRKISRNNARYWKGKKLSVGHRLKMSIAHTGHRHSTASRERMSQYMIRHIEKYGPNSLFRSHPEYYNDIYFHSSWEVELAQKLDEAGIAWRRPRKRFQYKHGGYYRNYLPDFFIPKFGYVEVKGWIRDEIKRKNLAKWNQFPNKLSVILGRKEFIGLMLCDTASEIMDYLEQRVWVRVHKK